MAWPWPWRVVTSAPSPSFCPRPGPASGGVEASFFVADVLADSLPDRFDIIVSSLFLHHLDTADAETLLARLAASRRRLLLISDLLRTPLGYGLAWALARLLSRLQIVHIYGLLSVRGAFQMHEVAVMAARAAIYGVDLRRCWPERYMLRWSPPPAVPTPAGPTPAGPTPGGASA